MTARYGQILAMMLTALLAFPAAAIERLAFSMDSIEGADWRAEGLQWTLDLSDRAASSVRIARLDLPAPYGVIKDLRIDCPGLQLEAGLIDCPAGTARARAEWLGHKNFPVRFRYRPANRQLSLAVDRMPAFGGHFDMKADYGPAWQVSVRARAVAAAQLGIWLPALSEALAAWQFDGPLDADIKATAHEVKYEFQTTGLTFSDASGRYAGEGLKGGLKGQLRRKGKSWQGETSLALPAGQSYIEPVFVDFGNYPATATAQLLLGGDGRIEIVSAEVEQPQVMQAKGSALWADGRLQQLQADAGKLQFPATYELYAKPYLLGTTLEALQTVGRGGVQVEWTSQGLQRIDATLDSLVLEDTEGRFAWDAVQGELHWRSSEHPGGAPPQSRLQWRGGAFYKLLFGGTETHLQLQGRDARLLAPLSLPVLQGELQINKLGMQGAGTEQMAVQFDGELKPVSLEALTAALGWPRFGGQLSGRLPELDYSNGVLTLGGALQARVFDGDVQISSLRVEDPFGRLPQLFADARLRNLDLEAVTQAFSFGRIEGRLDGDIENLHMLNWQPVAFDARLVTPRDDDSRHRISQRAIENISAIGGAGATAALSRGFLRFFDDFAYSRIGLSCRLSGGVCRMGGLGPSRDGNGYVLVEGRLLPRIDVIGFAREVDWATLVEQLKSVTEGEGPEVR